jgi:hypothetical protein
VPTPFILSWLETTLSELPDGEIDQQTLMGIEQYCLARNSIANIPRGVATPGKCVVVPPCAAYLSATFFTPGVSNMFLLVSFGAIEDIEVVDCVLWSDFADSSGKHVCSGNDGASANGKVTGSESRHA